MTEAQRGGRQKVIIGLAMAVSLWAHILALALWQYVEPAAAVPSVLPITIELELPPPPEPEPEAKNTDEEPPPQKAPPREEPKPPPEPEPEPTPDQTAATVVPPPDPSPPDQEESEEPGRVSPMEDTISLESRIPKYLSYLGQVKAGINAHWIFPPAARQNRESGRISLIFTLNRSGQLINIEVLESTGRPILDHAALEAIRGAAPFDPFPEHINLERLNIRAHFDYRIRYVGVD